MPRHGRSRRARAAVAAPRIYLTTITRIQVITRPVSAASRLTAWLAVRGTGTRPTPRRLRPGPSARASFTVPPRRGIGGGAPDVSNSRNIRYIRQSDGGCLCALRGARERSRAKETLQSAIVRLWYPISDLSSIPIAITTI